MNNTTPSFIPDASFWEVSSPQDYKQFFKALPQVLPGGSILYMEGTAISTRVREFLLAQVIAPPITIPRGTIWPRPQTYHLPVTEPNLQGLAELAQTMAGPEICDHLIAYQDDQVLLIWYDALLDSPLYLSKTIAEKSVRSFCRTLHCHYAPFS